MKVKRPNLLVFDRLRKIVVLFSLLTVGFHSEPAFALKRRTMIWRGVARGAVIGTGAGLVTYPFAKSTNTLIAGAAVGAILGAVYGHHLANEREKRMGPDAMGWNSDRGTSSSSASPFSASVSNPSGTPLRVRPDSNVVALSLGIFEFDL